jgi:hypothetical protein
MSIYNPLTNPIFNTTIVGDPGTEGNGINVNSVIYNAVLKDSDIGGANIAHFILHRHSTVWPSIMVGARSNSDTVAHVSVTNSMPLWSLYGVGYCTSYYNIFGTIVFQADDTGTISDTSSPGAILFSVTPDGSVAEVEVMRLNNVGALGFAGANFGATGQVVTSRGNTDTPEWNRYLTINASGSIGVGAAANFGTAGQVLTSGGNAAAPTWSTNAGPSYALIEERQPAGTDAGDSIAGTQTRQLNTVVSDPTGIVLNLAAGVVTLAAGTYRVSGWAQAYRATRHKTRLYDATNATLLAPGSNGYQPVAQTSTTESRFAGQFTLAAQADIRLDHYTSTAYLTNGLGAFVNEPDGDPELYAQLEIWKIA